MNPTKTPTVNLLSSGGKPQRLPSCTASGGISGVTTNFSSRDRSKACSYKWQEEGVTRVSRHAPNTHDRPLQEGTKTVPPSCGAGSS